MILTLDHVLIFVPSVRAAAQWYSTVLQTPASFRDENLASISIGDAKLSFHPADAKGSAGRGGQVAYWRVASLTEAMRAFEAAGASLYRGPLVIDSREGICQMADPFGNLVGLIGSYNGA